MKRCLKVSRFTFVRDAATFCLRRCRFRWDAEGSSTHVHCPRCGKIIARYVEQERRNRLELDRIDKVLFILPFLTLADTVSTEFSLMFGGMEGGPIAGPVYEQYGQRGLIALTIFSFFVSLGCIWFLRYAKTRINQGGRV